jgi:hypothetical protein
MRLHTVLARNLQAIETLFDCNTQPIAWINMAEDPGAIEARNMFEKHLAKGLPKLMAPSVGTTTLTPMSWPGSAVSAAGSHAVPSTSWPGSAVSATGSNAVSSTQAPSVKSSTASVYMAVPVSVSPVDSNDSTPEGNDPNTNGSAPTGKYPDMLFPTEPRPHGTTHYHGR